MKTLFTIFLLSLVLIAEAQNAVKYFIYDSKNRAFRLSDKSDGESVSFGSTTNLLQGSTLNRTLNVVDCNAILSSDITTIGEFVADKTKFHVSRYLGV